MAITKKEKHSRLHDDAMINFDRIQSALREERENCLEDRRFHTIAGSQWEGSLKEQYENKPKFEVNKIHKDVKRIVNEYRNNRITVDFVSKTGESDDKLTDLCQGLYRADERDSGAEEAYDNAFEEAVGGGYGAFRFKAEYEDEEDDENENQRIRIEPIYDADSSVWFDLDAKRQDKADANYCFVITSMTPQAYKETWDKEPNSVDKEISKVEYDWYSPDVVFVAEYYKVEYKTETIRIFKTLDGSEERYTDDDFEDDPELATMLDAVGTQEVREKKVKKRKIHKYFLSGNEVLEDCGIIAGKNIPIIPVYGERCVIDNVERCMGHVRMAKDMQRLKNMQISNLAEVSALSTIEKPIFTPEQVTGHQVMWSEDNIKNYPYLLLNALRDKDGNIQPAGAMGYTKPPQIAPAMAALLQLTETDMKDILGNQGEGDKMVSNISGKAVEAIQSRIDGQAYIYMSNMAKGIRRGGEVWLSMAKELYVEDGRKMKTIGKQEEVGTVELMEPYISDEGENTLRNDITKAVFDVNVDVGASSSTKREATVKSLMGMLPMVSDPQDQKVIQSMIMYNMEGEGLSEAKEYFRKQLVGMGVYKPTEEEQKAMEAAGEQKDANQKLAEAMATNEEAKAKKTLADINKVESDINLNTAKEAEIYNEMQEKNIQGLEHLVNTATETQEPKPKGLRALFSRTKNRP